MTVGERIKKRRLELGLTQEELALKMGYKGKTSVCVAENKGDNVTTTKVKKFAKALDISYNYLIGDYDENNNKPEQSTRAKDFIKLFENVGPDVQESVVTLLKSAQPKS